MAQRRPPAFKSGRVCRRSLSDECQLALPAPINGVVVFETGLGAQELTGILGNCLSPEVKTGVPRDGDCDVGVVGAGKNKETTSPPVVYFNLQAALRKQTNNENSAVK